MLFLPPDVSSHLLLNPSSLPADRPPTSTIPRLVALFSTLTHSKCRDLPLGRKIVLPMAQRGTPKLTYGPPLPVRPKASRPRTSASPIRLHRGNVRPPQYLEPENPRAARTAAPTTRFIHFGPSVPTGPRVPVKLYSTPDELGACVPVCHCVAENKYNLGFTDNLFPACPPRPPSTRRDRPLDWGCIHAPRSRLANRSGYAFCPGWRNPRMEL